MIKVDYIVVGLGLAGISFCEQLRQANKTFIVFDDSSTKSSRVAGGVYNPVVLKRFTAAWRAKEQLSMASEFYGQLEKFLDLKFDFKIPVLRKFNSVEEQNNWLAASDKPTLEEFLSLDLIENKNRNIDAPLGFGKVNGTGRVNIVSMYQGYKQYLHDINRYRSERFIYNDFQNHSDRLIYNNVEAKNIIFCEGSGLKRNPFFNHLPIIGNKGELLIIKSSELKLKAIIKSSVFLIPFENDCYYVGATYDREDQSLKPTERAKAELIKKLETLVSCPYQVIEHRVGIRPTVSDRKPLVGVSKGNKRIAVLNGLGTRGVMIGPWVARQLYKHINDGAKLDSEIDIARFK